MSVRAYLNLGPDEVEMTLTERGSRRDYFYAPLKLPVQRDCEGWYCENYSDRCTGQLFGADVMALAGRFTIQFSSMASRRMGTYTLRSAVASLSGANSSGHQIFQGAATELADLLRLVEEIEVGTIGPDLDPRGEHTQTLSQLEKLEQRLEKLEQLERAVVALLRRTRITLPQPLKRLLTHRD